MRSILTFLLFLALAGPFFAVDGVLEINQTCAVQTGCFAGDTAGFPVTISSSGSYKLTSNLIVPDENTDGIKVSSSSITIDLNGFEMVRSGCETATTDCSPGSGIGSGVAPSVTVRGISVRNGSITGMGAFGVTLGDQADVSGLRVRWNRLDGINAGAGSKISDNTAFQNGVEGIFASTGSRVSGNTAYENGGDGIFVNSGSIVTGNVSANNVGNGFTTSNQSTVSNNTAKSNGGLGISAGTGVTISNNTASANVGDGISARSGSTISRNTAQGNQGDGIRAVSGGSSIFDNTVKSNALDGIDCTNGGRSYVRGNSAIENTGFGLNLDDPIEPDAIYRENNVFDNTAGTVSGGNNRGDNSCRNNTGAITDCP